MRLSSGSARARQAMAGVRNECNTDTVEPLLRRLALNPEQTRLYMLRLMK